MAYRFVKDIWASLRQLANVDVWPIVDSGAPTDGTSGTGAGFAGPGSTYTDISTGAKYINTGTKASPVWSILASSGAFASGIVASGTNASGTTTGTSIAVTGALTTDIALVTWKGAPQTIAHIIATATTDAITVTFSTTVGTAGTLQYALIRAAQ